MDLTLDIDLIIKQQYTAAELVDLVAPLLPTPLPTDIGVTITGINQIRLHYTATFPTPLEAAAWLVELNTERLPQWYAALLQP